MKWKREQWRWLYSLTCVYLGEVEEEAVEVAVLTCVYSGEVEEEAVEVAVLTHTYVLR